jgi:hypothetical protein
MSRFNVTVADRRLTSLATGPAVALALAVALGACGGGNATSSPGSGQTSGPGESSGPLDTQGPGESEGPGETPGTGDGSEAFTAATTALDELDSYSYSVEIESVDSASGTTHSRLSGTVVNTDDARLLTMETLDESGTVTDSTGILIIGEDAWTRQGDETAPWTSIPAAQADLFTQSFAMFRPEQMFGTYFAGFGGNFGEVGTETKNGVETTHYQGDEALGAILGAIAGVQGTWSSDAWIATDGGYLVHSEASVEAPADGTGGSFSIVVNIDDINDAGTLERPA